MVLDNAGACIGLPDYRLTTNDTLLREPSSHPAWYCIQAKPSQEAYARMHLEKQQLEVFLPLLKSRRLYRRRFQWITKPLFARYLFARFNPIDHCIQVRSTRGVTSVVSFGGRFTSVPDAVIEELRSRSSQGVIVDETEPFTPGERVAIIAGPYQGLSAVFSRHTSAEARVIILLDIMSSVARVEIERAALRRNI